MNVNRFKQISKVGSVLLLIAGLVLLYFLGYISYQVFIEKSDFWFNFNPGAFSTHYSRDISDVNNLQNILRTSASIFTPIRVLVNVYALWKGSRLFKRLSDGFTPFNMDFSKVIKHIGLLLCITDIILPILYSLVVSVKLDGAIYISIGVGSTFLIGLILIIVSIIFDYGIELQHLSDETV